MKQWPEWIDEASEVELESGHHSYRCPNCKKQPDYFIDYLGDLWHKEEPNYCPNCGERLTR